MLTVMNKKTGLTGQAVQLADGWKVTIEGASREYADSTFKRFFKKVEVVGAEVVEEVAAEQVVEEVAKVEEVAAEQVEQVEEVPASFEEMVTGKKTVSRKEFLREHGQYSSVVTMDGYETWQTKKGVASKTVLELEATKMEILDYNGIVSTVKVTLTESGEVIYTSPKFSVKDAVEYLQGTAYEKYSSESWAKVLPAIKAIRKEVKKMVSFS